MKNTLDPLKIEQTYHNFIEHHPLPIIVMRSETGEIVATNKAAELFYGYTKEEFSTVNMDDINTYSKEDVLEEMLKAKTQKRNYSLFKHRIKSGDEVSVEVIIYPVTINNEEFLFSLINHKNGFSNNKSEESFPFNAIFNETRDAFIVVNSEDILEGETVYCNNAMAKMVDRKIEAICEVSFRSLFLDLDKSIVAKYQYAGGSQILTLNNREKTTVEAKCLKIRENGLIYSLIQLRHMNYEPIGDFKVGPKFQEEISSRFGHKKGYLLGVRIFRSMNTNLDYSDYLEFLYDALKSNFSQRKINFVMNKQDATIFLFTTETLEQVSKTLNYFVNTIEFSRESVLYNKVFKFRVAVSKKDFFGSSICHTIEKSMMSFSETEFNQVMYYRKSKQVRKEQIIKNDIMDAIENDDFVLFGQPIVDVESKSIQGIEILVRWQHELLGLISPKDFIHYAEITGQIKRLDQLVTHKSLQFIESNRPLIKALKMHINLSSRSFDDDMLLQIFKSYDIDLLKENVVFEITEESNSQIVTDTFNRAKEMGISFSIDDFGTGFSSFERVRQVGVDYIKIDRIFVDSLVDSPNDIIILKTILQMCHNLNIDVIAEGVETLEQIEFLHGRNCNKLQGYYFLEPQNLEDLFSNYDVIHKDIEYKLEQLNNPDIFSTKFYKQGRVFIQKLNDEYQLVEPNIQLAQRLKYNMEDILKANFLNLIPKDEWIYFKNAVMITNRTRDTILVNTEIYDANNMSYKSRCALKSNDDNGYTLYIEFVEDANDESELLGLSKSYTEAFYKSPVGMILLDKNYHIVKCNHSGEEIIGSNAAELLGFNILKIIPESTKELTRLFTGAAKRGYNEKMITITHPSDHMVMSQWVVSTVDESENDEKRYICIIQDITERIMLEKEKNKVYKALDQSKSAIIMTDSNAVIEYVNKTFMDITEYTREDVIGKNVNMLSSKEHNIDYYKRLWTAISNGDVWNDEFHNIKKTGESYWCKESIYPVKEQGQIIGFMGIQQDVTEEKKLQELNVQLKNRLFDQDKIASLGMLTSGIIHEINNPLSYIQMNLSYLRDELNSLTFKDKEQGDEIEEALGDIMEGVKQIKEIANGLKKYVYKNDEEIKDTINVVESMNEILVLTKNEYKYRVNVIFDYDEEEVYYIYGYASKFKQVIMNLIINATHAIIAKNLDGLGNIYINVKQSHDEVVIELTDDGIGMNQVVLDKIFNPLFTTKEQGVGTGLGLSVSKQIIEEDHSGQIICHSIEGQGTTFTIRLPIGGLL